MIYFWIKHFTFLEACIFERIRIHTLSVHSYMQYSKMMSSYINTWICVYVRTVVLNFFFFLLNYVLMWIITFLFVPCPELNGFRFINSIISGYTCIHLIPSRYPLKVKVFIFCLVGRDFGPASTTVITYLITTSPKYSCY